ncbi:hypothetical protein LPJ81_000599 [Coemansia sp. IMI 209127]|nr:hypothetical protein LPJ81_000599 [Coemansia sp. IMI 209127]
MGNKTSEPLVCSRKKQHHQQGQKEAATECPPKMYIKRINTEYLEQIDSAEAKAKRKRRTKRKLEQIMATTRMPPLGDLRRFSQENYVCSFCHGEEPTFQHLLNHISVVHPWYDLTVHKNIR